MTEATHSLEVRYVKPATSNPEAIPNAAIQGVRDRGMDLTGWLDFFVEGLATQMDEVKGRGERVIKADVLSKKHGLNERQTAAVRFLLEQGRMTIQDFEALWPQANRRTLQRDLKDLTDKGVVASSGATNQMEYKLI